MRAMTWLVGALVILLGFGAGSPRPSGWTAVWFASAVLWFFLGVGLMMRGLIKVVTGKIGAGLNAAPGQRPRGAPAPKEEHEH